LLKPDENPDYFIYFQVDPTAIDINIHPAKTEIKFENEQAIWSILLAAVKETLGKFIIAPSIDFNMDDAPELPTKRVSPENVHIPQTSFNPHYNPFGTSSYKRPVVDWEQLYSGFESVKTNPENGSQTGNNIEAMEQMPAQQTEITEIEERQNAFFQLKTKYIVSSVKSGMLLIDQHRAHLRIMYEVFVAQMENHKAPSQQVLFPEILEISEYDAGIFDEIRANLQSAGFDFAGAGKNAFEITGIPSFFSAESVVPVLRKLLATAHDYSDNSATAINEIVASSLAEAAAIKTGQTLGTEEMNDLIDRLFACKSPNFTPDGRSVMTIISMEEITAKFS
jgi:DNA mismatch repair protein MutL